MLSVEAHDPLVAHHSYLNPLCVVAPAIYQESVDQLYSDRSVYLGGKIRPTLSMTPNYLLYELPVQERPTFRSRVQQDLLNISF
jgi:hypothetical protein